MISKYTIIELNGIVTTTRKGKVRVRERSWTSGTKAHKDGGIYPSTVCHGGEYRVPATIPMDEEASITRT